MYYAIGASVLSLYRESTDSLTQQEDICSQNVDIYDVIPAVDQHRLITSPPLNPARLFHHISDTPEVRAVTIRSPVGDVKLYHLKNLIFLQKRILTLN